MASNYTFTTQAARGATLLGRFPAFNLGNFRLFTVGFPVYKSSKWNLHETRGPIIAEQSQAAQIPGRTGLNSLFFWEAMWTNAASAALNTANPIEVRRELAAFAGSQGFSPFVGSAAYQAHYSEVSASVQPGQNILPILPATGYAMGINAYSEWKGQPSIGRVTPRFNIFDSENFSTPAGQDPYTLNARQCGQMQKAMLATYQADPDTPVANYTGAPGTKPNYAPVWITNAQASFNTGSHFFSDADANGNPHYYSLKPVAFQDADLLKSLNDTGGYMSVDPYIEMIWPEDVDFFQRNPDGTVKLSGTDMVFNRTAQTYSESGYTSQIDPGEGEHLIHEIYRYAGCVVDNMRQLNGQVTPYRFSDRMAGAENIGTTPWFRHTNHKGKFIPNVDVNITANNRPVFRWIHENLAIFFAILTGYKGGQVLWSSHFLNTDSGQLPDPGQKNWTDDPTLERDQGTDGAREYFVKAWYRLSLLGDMLTNDGKVLLFEHPYRNSNRAVGDRPIEKILAGGKIGLHNGVMSVLVAAWWPGLKKGETKTLPVWINTGAGVREVHSLTLTGRDLNWVLFPLPADLVNIDPKDVYLAHGDLIGGANNILRRGELGLPVPAGTTVPAGGGTVTPTPTPGALTFGNVTYDGVNNKLKIPVTGAASTITYHIPGVGDFTDQPADGFTLPANAINTLVTYTARTATQAEIVGMLQCNSTGTVTPPTPPAPSSGWLSSHFGIGPNVYISYDTNQTNLDDRLRVMTTAHANGCNFVSLIIPASSMEFQNWDTLNQAGAKAKQLGMKIRLSLDLSPTISRIGQPATAYLPACPNGLVRQKNSDGVEYIGDGNTAIFSFEDPNAINYYLSVLDKWVPYFRSQDWSSEVVAVQFTTASSGEMQYDFAHYPAPNFQFTNQVVGYDAAALAAFRVRMQNRFGTIAALNQACNTSFSSFDALTFPVPSSPNLNSAFNGVYGSYFMLSRVYGLKKLITAGYARLTALAPNWMQILDEGSYIDNALVRGTANPALLTAGTGIQLRKSNGTVFFNHERDMDTCAVGGLLTANELDPRDGNVQQNYELIQRSRDAGCNLVTLNVYGISDANLIALLTQTINSRGETHLNVAQMVAAGLVPRSRSQTQSITFNQWTHLLDNNYDLLQAYNALAASGGVNIQYQTETLSA